MNELDYYTIKNLVNNVMKDLEFFDITVDTGFMFYHIIYRKMLFKWCGLVDIRNKREIRECLFNTRLSRAFNFLYNKVYTYKENIRIEKENIKNQEELDYIYNYIGVIPSKNTK